MAVACAGITVLAPSPTKPPRMPWISKVGSAQIRSKIEYSFMPVSARPVTSSLRKRSLSNGSFFQVLSSCLLGGSTDL